MHRKVNDMDIEKLAYDHGANIYENGEVRFYTLNAFNKFAEAYHQAKCNEEIQTLREQLANGKRLLSEQMELTNERTKICIELRAKVEVLVEALRNVVKCGEDRNESGMDWVEIANSRSQYLTQKNIIATKALSTYDKLSEVKE